MWHAAVPHTYLDVIDFFEEIFLLQVGVTISDENNNVLGTGAVSMTPVVQQLLAVQAEGSSGVSVTIQVLPAENVVCKILMRQEVIKVIAQISVGTRKKNKYVTLL